MRRRNAALRKGVTACLGELLGGLFDLIFGRLADDAGQLLGRFDLRVRVAGIQEVVRKVGEGLAAREVLQLGELLGG